MVAPWKILPCLLPAFVKIKDLLMPLPDLRSKSGSIAKNGFGSSRPKPWSRVWPASWKCIFVSDENFSLTFCICLRTCHFHWFHLFAVLETFRSINVRRRRSFSDFLPLSLPAGLPSLRRLQKSCKIFLDSWFVPGLGSTVRVGPWFPVSTVALFLPFPTYLESVSPWKY